MNHGFSKKANARNPKVAGISAKKYGCAINFVLPSTQSFKERRAVFA